MKKTIIGGLVVLALVGAGVWKLSSSAETAPDVAFTSLAGQKVTMQELRGKVVLVKFWATSCVTCIAQMPDTIKHYQELSPKGFDTIAVAMDYDPPSYVRNFAESRQLPFTVAMDTKGEIAQAFGNIKLTPTAFLIDKKGYIIKRYLGNYDETAFLATVNKALAG